MSLATDTKSFRNICFHLYPYFASPNEREILYSSASELLLLTLLLCQVTPVHLQRERNEKRNVDASREIKKQIKKKGAIKKMRNKEIKQRNNQEKSKQRNEEINKEKEMRKEMLMHGGR